MEATTANCQKCEDRGVIHTDTGVGFMFSRCDCRPNEYWEERSIQRAEFLRQMVVDAELKLG